MKRFGNIFLYLAGILFVGGLTLLPSRTNIAQTSLPERPFLLEEPIADRNGWPLSADSAARYALLKSLQIRIAQTELAARQMDLVAEKAKYDTTVELSATYEHEREEQPSRVFGDRTLTGRLEGDVAKKLPLGTTIETFYQNQRNSSNSAFATLSRNYESHAGITLRQSLLENAFGRIDRAQVNLVRLDISQFEEKTLEKIEKAVFEARQAYWDYARDVASLEAEKQAYELAREFYEITRDQLETGQAEEADYYAALANVARRTKDVLTAHLNAKMAMNRLKLILAYPGDILPTQMPQRRPLKVTLDDLLHQAMAHRRDYHAKVLELEAKGMEVRVAKNRLLPALTATATAASNALDRDMWNTQGEIWGMNHPTYFLGFELSFPWENRSARAARTKAELEEERARLELRDLQHQIYTEVSDAYQGLLTAHAIAVQAEKMEELEREKLAAEMRLFRVGQSMSKTIIDYQQDLVEAQKAKIAALADYEKARDKIFFVQHRLLEALGLTVEEI